MLQKVARKVSQRVPAKPEFCDDSKDEMCCEKRMY